MGLQPPTPLMPTPAEPQVFVDLTCYLSRLHLNKRSVAESLNVTELIHHFDFVDEATDSKQLRVRAGKDFPGGPVAKTALPMLGARIRPLVRQLDPTCCN